MSITSCGEVKFSCDCFILGGRASCKFCFWRKTRTVVGLTTVRMLLSYIIIVYVLLPQMENFFAATYKNYLQKLQKMI